jgi:Type III restriction enzyme, res subunit
MSPKSASPPPSARGPSTAPAGLSSWGRGEAHRPRVPVRPHGSLVEQWRDELFEKFGLQFNVFSVALEAATPTGNPFEDLDHLIVRFDQMAHNEELQKKLLATTWDLVIFDEAHKLSAHRFGSKLKKIGRFQFAEKIGVRTRHLLLLTATPRHGKDEDFQLFLSLLDSDRCNGKFRGGDGQRLVPCMAFFGANASGKINTLKAIDALKTLLREGGRLADLCFTRRRGARGETESNSFASLRVSA